MLVAGDDPFVVCLELGRGLDGDWSGYEKVLFGV